MSARWQKSRGLLERVLVTGNLVLETPALLGSGDAEGLVDMPLLLDPLEGRALLTGSSIAGALRNYLRRYDKFCKSDYAEMLFGTESGESTSSQSLVFVDDSLGDKPSVELRDGVAIDPRTGTAEDKARYDLELLKVGSSFKISFELLVPEGREKELNKGLAIALQGLENGEISLGGRKSRGFGRCKVADWEIVRYDMTKPEGLLAWLDNDRSGCVQGAGIAGLLGVTVEDVRFHDKFTLQAIFAVDSSLIIRSPGQVRGGLPGDAASNCGDVCLPDAVHLHSWRGDEYVPIVSGTSLAGVLRSRSVKIANTLGKDGYSLADRLFSCRCKDGKPTASRLWVEETIIQNPLSLVQSRIMIDRFTGGVYPSALFSEEPVFGKDDTCLEVKLTLENPEDWEVGLLLLLLKDLWTGDLPLGGGSAIGRGRLRGIRAQLVYHDSEWIIAQEADEAVRVTKGDVNKLEEFIRALGGM
jgi:CRISPR/Cas system CSM-associated protein Csm3 (group 7 of RAMP superfamily)